MSWRKRIVNSALISFIVFFSLVYLTGAGILITPEIIDWKVFVVLAGYVFTILILME